MPGRRQRTVHDGAILAEHVQHEVVPSPRDFRVPAADFLALDDDVALRSATQRAREHCNELRPVLALKLSIPALLLFRHGLPARSEPPNTPCCREQRAPARATLAPEFRAM